MLLPALSQAKLTAQSISCMSNGKQLGLAYIMYANDNNDIALPRDPYGPANATVPAWCKGHVVSAPEAVDGKLLKDSPTYRYLSSPTVFKCPSDRAGLLVGRKIQLGNRSRTVNGVIGDSGWHAPNVPPSDKITRLSANKCPGLSDVYVLIDEHENSINDSHFYPFRSLKGYDRRWLDAPSGRHGNATGFTFADGHSEIHKWVDSDLTKSKVNGGVVVVNDINFLPNAGPRDHAWVTNHVAPFK